MSFAVIVRTWLLCVTGSRVSILRQFEMLIDEGEKEIWKM